MSDCFDICICICICICFQACFRVCIAFDVGINTSYFTNTPAMLTPIFIYQ